MVYLAINLTLSWFARWLARRTASGSGKARRGKAIDPLNPAALLEAEAKADLMAANKGLGRHDGTGV